MSKNPCDLLREALVIIGSAAPYTWNAKDSAAWSERAAAFVKAHRDIKPLDGEWQSERPTQGLWWLSLHPDHRNKVEDWPEVVPVYVDSAGGCFSAGVYVAGNDYILTGALWQRPTVPGDPFAKRGK